MTSDKSTLDVVQMGRGRDLVLLHSLLSDRTAFDRIAPRLANERRVWLVHRAGIDPQSHAGRGRPARHGDAAGAVLRTRQRHCRREADRAAPLRALAAYPGPRRLLAGDQTVPQARSGSAQMILRARRSATSAGL